MGLIIRNRHYAIHWRRTGNIAIALITAIAVIGVCVPSTVLADRYSAQITIADSIVRGDTVTVELKISPDTSDYSARLGGIEVSLYFDSAALSLTDVTVPDELLAHGWAPPRFFLSRVGMDNCGSAQLDLILTADSRWYDSSSFSYSDVSVYLQFATNRHDSLFGDTTVLQFCWRTCEDNRFYASSKDTNYICNDVFDWRGNLLTDRISALPAMSGPTQACYDALVPIGTVREAAIDFYGGAVIFVARDEISDKGDVNLDGEAFSPSDLTLLGEHCLIGDKAFEVDFERQLEASDIDSDGLGGTVADWVALRYILLGMDTSGPARSTPPLAHFELSPRVEATEVFIDAESATNAFSIWFRVPRESIDSVVYARDHNAESYEAALTLLQDTLVQVAYSAGSIDFPAITEGYSRLLTVYHEDGVVLEPIHFEAATPEPRLFVVDIATAVSNETAEIGIPNTFSLVQNYPNPFNPGTTIQFKFLTASRWQLDIFDLRGRRVREYGGRSQSGGVDVYWNGRDSDGRPVASGVYFYRLTAGEFEQTRKMLLLR